MTATFGLSTGSQVGVTERIRIAARELVAVRAGCDFSLPLIQQWRLYCRKRRPFPIVFYLPVMQSTKFELVDQSEDRQSAWSRRTLVS